MITINETNTTDKILLFSDIHWGKSKDSDNKLNTSNLFIDNIITYCKSNNINTCLFLGDWFHNRNAICVKTFQSSYSALKRLSDANITIYLIVGNHDLYLKDSDENVNSIDHFSEIENVFIISNLTKIIFHNTDKDALLCPWNKLPENCNEKFDYLFGHLDFFGANMGSSIYSQCETKASEILKYSSKVFSGHFHIHSKYDYNEGTIYAIGCPFELDWGDYNNDKKIYIIDLKNDKIEFNEFNAYPKHVKILWSRVKSKVEKFDNITGNYIKFIIDEEYEFEKITKIANLINQKNPIKPCECEFVYNTNFTNPLDELSKITESTGECLSITEYFNKFIEYSKDNIKGLDKDKLKALATKYYTQCNVSEE
jgi:DNA repair exonuclease SbcCD nuclease subunit